MSCVFCQEDVWICLARTRVLQCGPRAVPRKAFKLLCELPLRGCDRTCDVVDTTDNLASNSSMRGSSHSFLPQTVFDSAPIGTTLNQSQCGLPDPNAVLGENQSDTSVRPPARKGLRRKRTSRGTRRNKLPNSGLGTACRGNGMLCPRQTCVSAPELDKHAVFPVGAGNVLNDGIWTCIHSRYGTQRDQRHLRCGGDALTMRCTDSLLKPNIWWRSHHNWEQLALSF